MKKNKEDTIRIDVMNVDREVGEAFKSFVVQKHGKLRGAFSDEVTMAFAEYLSSHANEPYTHTHQRNHVDEKIARVEEAVQAVGLLNAIDNGGCVRSNALRNVLSGSVGIDPRTINNYYNAFCRKHELTTNLNGEITRI